MDSKYFEMFFKCYAMVGGVVRITRPVIEPCAQEWCRQAGGNAQLQTLGAETYNTSDFALKANTHWLQKTQSFHMFYCFVYQKNLENSGKLFGKTLLDYNAASTIAIKIENFPIS